MLYMRFVSFRYTLSVFLLAFSFCQFVGAQTQSSGSVSDTKKIQKQKQKAEREEQKANKKKYKTRENYIMVKTAGTVYVFGVSQSLGKDEVYMTDISTIDSLALQKKTGFLPFRSSFSTQLQQYTEGVLGQTHQTVSIFFSTKREKLQKELNTVKKRYLSNANKSVTTINQEQFHFVHPLDLIERPATSETE